MKTYALPVLSLTFGLLVISRAASVSTEIVPQAQAADVSETQQANINTASTNPDMQCLTGDILETITADMTRLNLRKAEISEREVALSAIEEKLKTQMATIEDANASLQAKIDNMKAVANEDLLHLVGMYQTMKPKQAAEIFNSMDAAFAAGFLREMSSDNAGMIMANMDPQQSYTISVIIAGRNAKYRTAQSQ